MSMDMEEQYDKIYRYCYFKLHQKEAAEDITQETFLRFLDSHSYKEKGTSLQYLYTIAGNLCIDEYRRRGRQEAYVEEVQQEMTEEATEEDLVTAISLKMALAKLEEEERELLLLRYVNEVPIGVLCKMFGISRFALYRRTKKALQQLEKLLGKEGFDEQE